MNIQSVPHSVRIHCVGFFVVAGFALLTVKMGVGSNLRYLHKLKDEQQKLTQQAENQTELRNVLSEGEKRLERIQKDIATLEQQLPQQMNFEAFYAALNECAEQTHCQLSGLQPGQSTHGQGYEEMIIPFKVYGSFPDCYNFLHLIVNAPRICKLEQLVFRAGQDAQPFAAEVSLKIFASAKPESQHDS